ncbi:hypothetical protein INT47_007261 [Mucor saturninus]|uniref:Arrestin C-terminal-like domain-containing protein n=1 Tax=Mucor saturninus TaxID=64648 RepID=A0A8H7RAM7_9FUNG|nr:hypothetical protein INT47_007261 [Mucor saturninus]
MGRVTNPSTKLKIHLENEQLVMYGSPSESSGCVLRGALSLRLNRPTNLKSLTLSFQGTMSVSWNQWNGYERKHSDSQILITHTWTFLPAQQNKEHSLAAGNHSYEFELVLPGSLPESTHVAKYYLVQYQLKANAERSSFLMPNYNTRRDIHLSRQKLSLSIDYLDPIMITNHWTDKLDYEINLPTKVYSHGDTIPITVRAIALAPNLKIRFVSCTFKEYMTCRAINGWFNGKNKSHSRIIYYSRMDQEGNKGVLNYQQDDGDLVWSTTMNIDVPESMSDIQCDANNESVRVRHKLKFTVSIANDDGHISELRAVLPVVIAITNTVGGLPTYEETSHTLPYDPVIMMALIRASEATIGNSNIIDLITNARLRSDSTNYTSVLPSYSSITVREDQDRRLTALPSYYAI